MSGTMLSINWARYFGQKRRDTTANGSTYVVTGVDKTSACSMLTFPNRPPTRKMSASSKPGCFNGWNGCQAPAQTTVYHLYLIVNAFLFEAYALGLVERNGLKTSQEDTKQTRPTQNFFSTTLDCPSQNQARRTNSLPES
ncbi:hypothetical protein M413DRAFT_357331 [Hebeloma cylindrosporum]|uniref:Uncharacterized protein n=1 Tax=Hebeloma cylindrosporum TaxID=76867 RepID=A0A0C2YUE3_HEBCY|nr:hypothetical protein M413DRAFT_357331 [Hebeloma cylindrosporum h7]